MRHVLCQRRALYLFYEQYSTVSEELCFVLFFNLGSQENPTEHISWAASFDSNISEKER